jgi:hypothetical protein
LVETRADVASLLVVLYQDVTVAFGPRVQPLLVPCEAVDVQFLRFQQATPSPTAPKALYVSKSSSKAIDSPSFWWRLSQTDYTVFSLYPLLGGNALFCLCCAMEVQCGR